MHYPAIIMLDTNMVSYAVRGTSEALNRHLRHVPINRLCVSSITEGELRYGLARNLKATHTADDVRAFLSRVETLPWDSDAAERYGVLRATLEKAGTPLGTMDTLIAAHALSVGALLVTNDRTFRQIKGLKTVDWTKT